MQQQPPREDLSPWFLTLNDLSDTLDWNSFFPQPGPIELDVGCGRGLFLYNESLAHPERNFLGIEIDYREGRRTATRLKKRDANNARVLGGDAREALQKYIPPASVAVVHVLFPDPWWKRKHRRRRVFNLDFVNLVAQVLVPGGVLAAATDVAEYFDVMTGLMDHNPQFVKLDPANLDPDFHHEDYATSFERKAVQTGGEVHRARWRLIAS